MRLLAERDMSNEEKHLRSCISSTEFRARLDQEYTPEQKHAVVAVLTAIGHGEAYGWLVSASLLSEVRSTGAKAALTLQILEEAKHFVVMRELVQAFGVGAPRQSAWEYLLLERTLKAQGIDRLFGMNVLVESIALGIFGALSTLPGLEVLRLFHLDESRHTALPVNYFREFPMSARQRRSALGRLRRLQLSLPTLPLIMLLEPDLAVLGIDAFELAGSVMRKGHPAVQARWLLERRASVQADGVVPREPTTWIATSWRPIRRVAKPSSPWSVQSSNRVRASDSRDRPFPTSNASLRLERSLQHRTRTRSVRARRLGSAAREPKRRNPRA